MPWTMAHRTDLCRLHEMVIARALPKVMPDEIIFTRPISVAFLFNARQSLPPDTPPDTINAMTSELSASRGWTLSVGTIKRLPAKLYDCGR